MLAKIKYVLIVLVATAVIFASSSLIGHTVSADDYQVSPGSKCQNGSDPTATDDGKFNCADSTRTQSGTTPTTATRNPGADPTDSPVTCAIQKVGWILCPIISTAAEVSDKTFQILADNFLRTDALLVSNDSGTHAAWDIARNIANVMLIGAFLLIILSQVTGRGLNNYGIKRMLPRLVVAAIAANISYYICQLAVDFTNILGYNIEKLFTDIANSLGPSVFGSASNFNGGDTARSTVLTVIAYSALAAAGVAILMLAELGPILLAVIVTVTAIIVILLLRKALIVLLIVVSPIAIMLYLLPNTERFFTKWRAMFGQLLMVFPIVGMLFGGGQLASTIILVSGAQDNTQVQAAKSCNPDNKQQAQDYRNKQAANLESYDTCGSGSINISGTKDGGTKCGDNGGVCSRTVSWTLGLVAVGVAVAPLMAVWAVLKGALAAAGAIGGKVAGAVERNTGSAAKSLKDRYDASTVGKMRAREQKIKEGAIRAGAYDGSLKNPLNWSRRARSGVNRALNNVSGPGLLDQYGKQRDRQLQAELSQRTREKADEYVGNGNYVEQFDRGFDDFQKAQNKNDRDEALLMMNAAMIAASRLDDRAQLERMRPLVQERMKVNRGTGGIGAQEATQNSPQMNQVIAQEAVAASAARVEAAQAQAAQAQAAQQARVNQLRAEASHELTMQQLEASKGPIDNVEIAHELAQREDSRRPPNPPTP